MVLYPRENKYKLLKKLDDNLERKNFKELKNVLRVIAEGT